MLALMRQAARSALQAGERSALTAGFATQAPADYSLTMKKAAELSSERNTSNGEVGLCAGIPLETYKRPVGACEAIGACWRAWEAGDGPQRRIRLRRGRPGAAGARRRASS